MSEYVFYATPKEACCDHETNAPIIAVKFGETGYWPVRTRLSAQELNEPMGWSDDEIESAILASHFGWTCPAAKLAYEAAMRKERGQ